MNYPSIPLREAVYDIAFIVILICQLIALNHIHQDLVVIQSTTCEDVLRDHPNAP